jgi:hypothetical protein
MNPFIWTKDNTLTSEFCNHCISKFESDDRKYNGVMGSKKSYCPDFKQSTDLTISILDEWENEDNVFYESITNNFDEYASSIKNSLNVNRSIDIMKTDTDKVIDTGYQIQRTKPLQFYDWHNDASSTDGKVRVITFIWYLNTIIEDGYTEFWDGTKVQPEQGKMLMFPATWDFMHRGYPPKSETKYICTGWLHYQI